MPHVLSIASEGLRQSTVRQAPTQKFSACACVHARSRAMVASSRQAAGPKVVHLLRHGQTEMNVFLEEHDPAAQRTTSPDFEDPLLYDTKLTEKGVREATRAAKEAAALSPPPQLVVSSPLSRALHTADLAFSEFKGPRLALSLARERTYFASDVGIKRSELARLWPHWSFEGVTDEVWWLDHSEDKSDPKAVIRESEEHFKERMDALKRKLLQQPEQSIALVVHRDIVESLAQLSPGNCEFTTIEL